MVNKVTLIGHLGKDPEARAFDGGTMNVKVSLATNESFKDRAGAWQTNTEWHNLVFWRELAERASGSLKKGMLVYVEGKIEYREWQDQDGNKRYSTDIKVHNFRILSGKEKSEGGESAPSQYAAVQTAHKNEVPVGLNTSNPDDDLPF